MATIKAGLLVVRRTNPAVEYPDYSRPRAPAVSLSDEEILRRYRGFEGQAWPTRKSSLESLLENDLASVDQYDAVKDYYLAVSKLHQCDLLYLQPVRLGQPANADLSDFAFCGFDYGGYFSQSNHYSVVYNEVISGVAHDALRDYAAFLNENLLLPTQALAEDLGSTSDQLRRSGASVEEFTEDELLMPIAIYCLSM